MNLTTIILTYNERANLPACLASVKGLDSEIFVVDSGSTDGTKQIAKAAGAKVSEHPFENYAAQRNWLFKNLPIETEWVLHLDADERLTPELVAEIRERFQRAGSREQGVGSSGQRAKGEEQSVQNEEQSEPEVGGPFEFPQDRLQSEFREHGASNTGQGADHTLYAISHEPSSLGHQPSAISHLPGIDGFLLRKRTYFMGRWIKHGGHYPSYHLRLFRKGKGFCEERLYDQHFVVDGQVEKLKHDYIDILSSDLNTWTQRHMRWAELEARQLLMENHSEVQVRPAFFGNPIERKRWLRKGPYENAPLYVRPFLYWFYRYFLRLSFLDGKEGFIFHFLQGLWFRLMVDIKIDELRRGANKETERLGDWETATQRSTNRGDAESAEKIA